MGIKYVYNPFSATIEPISLKEIEEEFFIVNEDLENNRMIYLQYIEEEKSERIILNGLELSRGSNNDYIILNGIINFNEEVLSEGDRIKIHYIRRY